MADEPHTLKLETDVPVPMRDGTLLFADVYRPDAPGRFPVILQRTPYNRAERRTGPVVDPVFMAQRGYAVVIQDVRGRHSSQGEFRPFHQERADGFDTVQWCAAQPWSGGKVGTYGSSYVGATQWLAAAEAPPALVCMAPAITTDGYHEGWTYQGGALQLWFVGSWTLQALTLANLPNIARRATVPPGTLEHLVEAIDGLPASLAGTPLTELPHLDETLAPYFFEWLRHPADDDYWRAVRVADAHAEITAPALNIAGWFDIFLGGTIRNFLGMRARGASKEAREDQRLVIGPWAHTSLAASMTGTQYYGLGATVLGMDLMAEHLRWYDHWLKGADNGVEDDPPVRIFVMGDNVWRAEQEWPPARVEYVDYFLHSGSKANSLHGDGTLSPEPPGETEPPDRFDYDPRDPVPTQGGALCCVPVLLPGGPMDQREAEERADVLCYSTPPLERDTEVTGPLIVTLFAATDAPDTDFTAKLVDVREDGLALGLADGIIRARYREGRARAVPITPGQVHEYVIDLAATSNVFKRGHRIRLEVSSSNFPRFDRNPNTGEEPALARGTRRAAQTILHTAAHPSRITLPVIPR